MRGAFLHFVDFQILTSLTPPSTPGVNSFRMNSNFSGQKLFTFVLSREHGYAAGVALSSWVVLQYMGISVMKARKQYVSDRTGPVFG